MLILFYNSIIIINIILKKVWFLKVTILKHKPKRKEEIETLFKGETRSSRRLTDTQFSYSLMIKSSSLTYAAPYTHIRSLFKYH